VAELIWRLRSAARPSRRTRDSDLLWVGIAGGGAALVLGAVLMVSMQAACAMVLVVLVVAMHQHDRRWGIAALFALWFLAPLLRRTFALATGFVEHDPLSLAPFLATAAIAAIELSRVHVPTRIRRITLLAAGGFTIGLPLGLVHGPSSAIYAFTAYLAAVSGAVLGIGENHALRRSNLRRVLLFMLPVVAIYAIVQRVFPLFSWDQAWIDATNLASIGASEKQDSSAIRAFASLNSPGALAGLLGLSLLCFLTVRRARPITLIAVALVLVALSVTFVRSAWVALIVAGVAHVVVSNGRSAKPVLGAIAVAVAAAIALSPVSNTAHDVVTRFKSIAGYKTETSSTERGATLGETLPTALQAPLGHGLGSAGEPSKLNGQSPLRAPDNGYLALMYQVGPLGFTLVVAAIALMFAAAWEGARARAPGQELRQLLFALLVFFLVLLTSGDSFYGSHGVILWFIGGQVLGYQYRSRAAQEVLRREREIERARAFAAA
jgi:putative inorganic carbon (hco3(-)) transporter